MILWFRSGFWNAMAVIRDTTVLESCSEVLMTKEERLLFENMFSSHASLKDQLQRELRSQGLLVRETRRSSDRWTNHLAGRRISNYILEPIESTYQNYEKRVIRSSLSLSSTNPSAYLRKVTLTELAVSVMTHSSLVMSCSSSASSSLSTFSGQINRTIPSTGFLSSTSSRAVTRDSPSGTLSSISQRRTYQLSFCSSLVKRSSMHLLITCDSRHDMILFSLPIYPLVTSSWKESLNRKWIL